MKGVLSRSVRGEYVVRETDDGAMWEVASGDLIQDCYYVMSY